jgi:uncharacterized protein YehS (DUF1456 family)
MILKKLRLYLKLKTQNLDEELDNSDIQQVLKEISILLNNINSRLDQCEKGIKFLTECKIKEEEEKLSQKLHDEEIFRSYIN